MVEAMAYLSLGLALPLQIRLIIVDPPNTPKGLYCPVFHALWLVRFAYRAGPALASCSGVRADSPPIYLKSVHYTLGCFEAGVPVTVKITRRP